MKLIDMALAASRARDAEAVKRYEESLRIYAREIKDLTEGVFGLPFEEAFDTEQVTFDEHVCHVGERITLEVTEDGLLVKATDVHGHSTRHCFGYTGPQHHADNLVTLGYMLRRIYDRQQQEAA